MTYPAFAYSWGMQIILAVITFVFSFVFLYMIADLGLMLYGEEAGAKRKWFFALLIGCILNTTWVHTISLLRGTPSLSTLRYMLIVTPNPVFAVLYYFMGIKVLRLSHMRSIKLMGHIFFFYIVVRSLGHLFDSVFFVQAIGDSNYLLELIDKVTFFVIFVVGYFIARYLLRRSKNGIKLRDSLFVNKKREVAFYFFRFVGVYLLIVGLPFIFSDEIAANFCIFVVLALAFSLSILYDLYKAAKSGMENRDAHVDVLLNRMQKTGYESVTSIGQRLNENPSLVSILLDKCNYAAQKGVQMNVELYSNIRNLNIDNIDACKIIHVLLQNAIESAASSEKKWVYFAIETKSRDGKLVVVNNSIPSPDSAYTPQVPTTESARLDTVRKLLAKYGNCSFQVSYYNGEISAYLEIAGSDA